MAQIAIKELLEAGVHFGHQTRRWNPAMRRNIFGEREGIHIIDLLATERMLAAAQEFAAEVASRGGKVLFVGTKKQARDVIEEVAEAASMPYVNHRWLGGLLTNFETISKRIERLHELHRFDEEGQLELLPTREQLTAEADLAKLKANLWGVRDMQRPPAAMFVIDIRTEAIAVREARRLDIPLIAVVDTNCDPEGIDYVIPGNDDAMRSCSLLTHAIGDVVREAHATWAVEEEQRRRSEEAERERRAAEERAKREAEEQARREAEEDSARQAEQRAREAGDEAPEAQPPGAVADTGSSAGREAGR